MTSRADDRYTPQAEEFVRRINSHFGKWKGDATAGNIARWLTERNVSKQALDEAYLDLIETRSPEPVNTIGIPDVAKAVDRHRGAYATAALPEPGGEVLPRDEAAARWREVLDRLTGEKSVRRTT